MSRVNVTILLLAPGSPNIKARKKKALYLSALLINSIFGVCMAFKVL